MQTEFEVKRIALVAAAAAVLGLAACSNAAAPASHGTGTAIVPVSCRHQYEAWRNGDGKGLMAAVTAVAAEDVARNPQLLTTALRQAQPAVTRGARYPIPACADPMGYWYVLMMHLNAAAKGSTASSVQAAMAAVPKINDELTAELSSTTQ
jgi:hypothetical protein